MEEPYINIHQDLIEECRKGDSKAQLRIYKLYYKAMYNTCFRIVNDSAEAEDILQESFLDAFRKINSYTGEGSFGKWVKRIVVNNSLDALKKKRSTLPIEEKQLDLPDEPVRDYNEDEIQFQLQEVKDAIEILPREYKVIITLYLIEGYDHEEISEILKISNNLSRTRYSRARQKLLSIVKENRVKNTYIYN
ncbi:MAG: sigma-70 family RNA polymerase sigma factor [bacterium]